MATGHAGSSGGNLPQQGTEQNTVEVEERVFYFELT